MDSTLREPFNRAYTTAMFQRYEAHLVGMVGAIPFRLAETPLFLDQPLREQLASDALSIVGQIARPAILAELEKAVPARYFVQGRDPLPDCVQVDFALTPGEGGRLAGRVIELQAFPSLYALETLQADAWAATLAGVPGMPREYSAFFQMSRAEAVALMRRRIVGDNDPAEVALVDYEPTAQKTLPDFIATKQLFGVDAVCVTKLVKDGRRLFRDVAGVRVPVRRIYNRMVFDELAAKNVDPPFGWGDDLDVSWCSHPNWYWIWSKFALPFIDHVAVPRARFLDRCDPLPDDLSRFVLKPLFSFAGAGVVVDVTKETIAAIPKDQRHGFLLQEKVEYAYAIRAPDGIGVKAEVRVMVMRDGASLVPLLPLVRLSRGKMLGVDYNRGLDWVGSSVGLWGT